MALTMGLINFYLRSNTPISFILKQILQDICTHHFFQLLIFPKQQIIDFLALKHVAIPLDPVNSGEHPLEISPPGAFFFTFYQD
jgi:hypothetical protein